MGADSPLPVVHYNNCCVIYGPKMLLQRTQPTVGMLYTSFFDTKNCISSETILELHHVDRTRCSCIRASIKERRIYNDVIHSPYIT
jgi:hypothetical protein